MDDRAVERFFGIVFVAAGGLIFTLCGLCTLGFAGTTLISSMHEPTAIVGLLLPAVIGGLPTLFGFWLARTGYRWFQGPKSELPSAADEP